MVFQKFYEPSSPLSYYFIIDLLIVQTACQTTLSVNVSPTAANVILNNSQVIQCIVSGSPSATAINWYRRTNNIESAIQIAKSNGKYSGGSVSIPAITINSFQSSDAGVYLCRATNAYGTASSPDALLTFIQPMSITVSLPSGNANYGTSSYTIQCTVSGTNPTFVSWTKTPIGGGSQTISTGSGKYNINNIPTNPFLTIFNIVEEDEADYACTAQNLAGTVTSSNARLIVDGASLSVNVSPTSANVILNNNQVIQCIVSGSPSATAINWYRRTNNVETQIQIASSNGKYSGGSVSTPALTVNSFQSSDAGVYLCKATNAYGTASSPDSVLTFIQPVSISIIQPLSGTAIVGDASYTITCTVFGTNPTFVSWTKTPTTGGTSTTLTQGTGKYSINSSPTNPTLTISNIVKTDEADYACSAQNLAGTVTSSNARLTVNGGALTVTITPTNPTAVIDDATVQIQCTISGLPQATNWYWTFLPLGSSGSVTTIPQGTNSADYFVENSNTNPHLTIRNILKTDEGDYVCFGTNVVGTSQSNQARLTITGVSETNTTITSWTKPPTISETATTIVTGCGAKIDTTEGKELFIAGIITLSVGVVAVIVGAVVLYRGCLYRTHNRAENYIDLNTSNHSITEPYSTLNQPKYIEIQDGR